MSNDYEPANIGDPIETRHIVEAVARATIDPVRWLHDRVCAGWKATPRYCNGTDHIAHAYADMTAQVKAGADPATLVHDRTCFADLQHHATRGFIPRCTDRAAHIEHIRSRMGTPQQGELDL